MSPIRCVLYVTVPLKTDKNLCHCLANIYFIHNALELGYRKIQPALYVNEILESINSNNSRDKEYQGSILLQGVYNFHQTMAREESIDS